MAERSIAAVLKTVEPRGSGGSNPSLSANQNPWWRQRTCPLPFSFEASPTSQQTGAGPPAAAQGKTSEATSTPKTPPRQKSSDIIPTISRDICALAHVPRTLTVSLPERRIRSWQGLRSETRRSRKRRPLILRKIPKRRYRSQENKKSDKDQWNLIFNYLQMIQALLSNNPNVRHFVAPPLSLFSQNSTKKRLQILQPLDFMSCWRGLNSWPLPYQGSALPLSYNSDRLENQQLAEVRKGNFSIVSNIVSNNRYPQSLAG